MTLNPHITVAPNGARLGKQDHPMLPLATEEIATTAKACQEAGADRLHLHIRDANGFHSLDAGRYSEVIAEVTSTTRGMSVQVTTEAGDFYSVTDQLSLIEALKPKAASIAVREIAREPELAACVYGAAQASGTEVQHIFYGQNCFRQLARWHESNVVPGEMRNVIVVLGKYAPPRAGRTSDLEVLIALARAQNLKMTVCAFGPQEQMCLVAAARAGCNLRVGFENNLYAPDGSLWPANDAAVASLCAALQPVFSEG